MAEDFQLGSGNWWEPLTTTSSSSRLSHNRFDVSSGSSSLDSASASGDQDGAVLSDHHGFHMMMGLGLSSSRPIAPTWNNTSLFSPNANFQQDSSCDYDKQMNPLSLDQSTAATQLLGGAAPPCQGSNATSSDFDFSCDISSNYDMKPAVVVGDVMPSSSLSKYPQFLRTKEPQVPQLQFSNNTAFWNATNDARFGFFPVDEKPKASKQNTSEVRDSKKTGSGETPSKRPRDQHETPTTMPAFKVKKEKMGDRITALQQLISPFGKTDTASVLSEAIEYIKFLHDQVNVLSTPYMKNSGVAMRHQQNLDECKKTERGNMHDLKSRGLCLVPISCTFHPTPTSGGCFN